MNENFAGSRNVFLLNKPQVYCCNDESYEDIRNIINEQFKKELRMLSLMNE